MSATPNIPAIPDDTQLSELVTERPDWAELSVYLRDMTGKELVDAGELGEAEAQTIAAIDTRIKLYQPQFEDAYWASAFGAVEKAGKEFGERIRLAEIHRCKTVRAICARIQSEVRIETDRRAAAEVGRLEAEQRRIAEEERRRELDALRQASEATKDEGEKAIIDAQWAEVADSSPVPVVVSQKQVAASVFKQPAGISGKSVCYRRVESYTNGKKDSAQESLRKLFAYLGSEQGKGDIARMCRIRNDGKSDAIITGFTGLKNDLTTEYPGLVNSRGTEVANRGR